MLLWRLEELANEKLQEKLWVRGNENQMSSFTEAICGVFDDARLTRALEAGYLKSNFSADLCRKVYKLDQLINMVPDKLPPTEIVKHPKMNSVRALSGELLDLFKSEIPALGEE